MSKQRCFILLVVLLCINNVYGSHIVGLELYYTHQSGSTYTITLTTYADCGPVSSSAFATLPFAIPVVCIYDGNVPVSSISLVAQAPIYGIEVTPVCPKDSLNTQCTSTSNPIPGIKKFIYSANYAVPYSSALWRFIFTGNMSTGSTYAGRAAAITNVVGITTTQLVDTLDNTLYDNSNPLLTTVPVPFFCLNNSNTYNPGAIDLDGDSLVFSLVDGIDGTTNCFPVSTAVTYAPGYSGSSPLGYTPGSFYLDGSTGQVSFVPDILQRSLVVYNIREFRGGSFVGSCQREMTFLVVTCANTPPHGWLSGASKGRIEDSIYFVVCQHSGTFSLTITPVDTNPSDKITVNVSGLPVGASFNIVDNITSHPLCTLNWTTTDVPVGTYIFYMTFKDDACPLSNIQTQAFTIEILPAPIVQAAGDSVFCFSGEGVLSAYGAESYVWSPPDGLGCTTCMSTAVNRSVTTLYKVTGMDKNGCSASDTASLTVVPYTDENMLYDITPSQSIAYGSSIRLEAKGAWIYNWQPVGSLNNPNINNPIATPLERTTYIVYGYNRSGCLDSGMVTIDVITNCEDVPSAFTPNGDGLNDIFRVINLGYGTLIEMTIYNRWGECIFRTNDNCGWDGTYNGTLQDIGVYYYQIIIERENHKVVHYKGDVTLVR